MSAKSDTQLPGFICNERRILFQITILAAVELREQVEEIMKIIRIWDCGTSCFRVMTL